MQRIQPLFEIEGLLSAKEFRLVLAFRGVVSDNGSEYHTARSCVSSSSFRTTHSEQRARDCAGESKHEPCISEDESERQGLERYNADGSSVTESEPDAAAIEAEVVIKNPPQECSISPNRCLPVESACEISPKCRFRPGVTSPKGKEDEKRLPLYKLKRPPMIQIPDFEDEDIGNNTDESPVRVTDAQSSSPEKREMSPTERHATQ